MKRIVLIACLCAPAWPAAAQNPANPLENAKSLYLSASYQEALASLDAVQGDAQLEEAGKYRALCLLGLNRPQEAQQAIERLIARRPMFALDPLDSPKLQAVYRDARVHVLPTTATELYTAAKAAFDRHELAKAVEQFSTVVTLVSQPEIASNPAVADLKMLAGGFASLAQQELSTERKLADAPAAQPAPPPTRATADRIYTDQDADVVPPVPIAQEIPQWIPPNIAVRSVTFSGALDVVVDEQGNVTTATITRPTLAPYDQLLLAAAKRWRYRPASFSGHTVKYRKTVHVTLQPQGSGPRGSGVVQ